MLPKWCPSTGLAVALLLLAPLRPASAQPFVDVDGDGLDDAWEVTFGLDPTSAAGVHGRDGDPDGDGMSNIAEQAAGTHPLGLHVQSFAEGATGDFFDARFAYFNPDPVQAARVLVRYLTSDGVTVTRFFVLAPLTRLTLDPEQEPALASAAFSTLVESDVRIVVDRTMKWGRPVYGSHAETGIPRPSDTWFLAEGSTGHPFDLFYLIQNPHPLAVRVDVNYLLPSGAPLVRSYHVAPNSRFTIWVDGQAPELRSTDVSAVVTATRPIVVERAMYADGGGRFFGAGHAGAAITSPALSWLLAEGATGPFFDLFVLIANPNAQDADVEVTYLLPDGRTITKPHTVRGRTRYTIWVDLEDAALADTAVSTIVRSRNGAPILVERAMWWPGGAWYEAHASSGTNVVASRWALADGEVGGGEGQETFVLVANVSDAPGVARVTLFFEDGGTASRDYDLRASSRLTVSTRLDFPETVGRRFATTVESIGATPLDLVVERAMYGSADGRFWSSGTNALGTPLGGGAVVGGLPGVEVTVTTLEGRVTEEGGDPGRVAITRSSTTGSLTVYYSVVGSASPADIQPLPGVASFAPGQNTVVLDIVPVDDAAVEGDETVVVVLSLGQGYRIGFPSSAQVVIVDDDWYRDNDRQPTAAEASRFLTQATFGPTMAQIAEVQRIGYRAWFDQQLVAPQSSLLGYLDAVVDPKVSTNQLQEAWMSAAMQGPDQLRQRVANALLEIMVVAHSNGLQSNAVALGAYMDLLLQNAFGNFRTLLTEVTLNPAMGRFLDMLQNEKEDPRRGRIPNENYARELLQLFSIGLHQLNLDGSLRLDGEGRPIPTFTQEEVEGFSRVFTGWTYHQVTTPYRFRGSPADWRNPMIGLANFHSIGEKRLLDGVVLPAGQTPLKDLHDALNVVFRHPNVGPFISRQLIQRLVTSNPSPGYVRRVAMAFNDNGAGVRGDMAAVVKAILFDEEARSATAAAHPHFGHLREPMIRFVTVLRAFNGRAPTGKFRVWNLDQTMGQAPFRAPSVFNFFAPDYAKPGPIQDLGLVSPEFQITHETTAIRAANTMRDLVYRGYSSNEHLISLDLSVEQSLAGNVPALVERLNVLLLNGRMSSEMATIVREAVEAIPVDRPLSRARAAVHLVVNSPEFVVQK